MTSGVSPTPRPRSDARIYKAITEMEHRLMDRLDKGIDDVMKAVQERKDETKAIDKELQAHKDSDGHPLLAARVAALEAAQLAQRQRPMQTWQVVTAACFVMFSFVSDVVSIVSLIHSLTH